jgi:hypothetical protein
MRNTKSKIPKLILLVVVSLLMTACNLPFDSTQEGDYLPTYVAQTLSAFQTQQTIEETQEPTGQPTEKETEVTPSPTLTTTPIPTETEVPEPCDQALFVEHVTIPPNTVLGKNVDFTKIWKVQNTGSCTWTTDYALEFVAGDSMDAPLYVPLGKSVAPDAWIDLTLFFTTPNTEDTYVGYWALVNEDGTRIPMENTPGGNLEVAVKVNVPDTVVYDFTEKYCSARWQSIVAPNLDCPDETPDAANGYVIRLEDGELENGKDVEDPILVTRPDNGDLDGFISGTYPAFNVQSGDIFMATIGCAPGASNCFLDFALQYQIGNGSIRTLKTWREDYDGKVNEVVVDLSDLAGSSVKFILKVSNINTDQDNEGYWFDPRIMR